MKNGKNKNCLECGKLGTFCKGLCQACYVRKYRSTPKGNQRMKFYNDNKGKEARIRYLAKQPPKPPKEIKICECGEIAKAKEYCMKCYQKYYQRKKYNWKERVGRTWRRGPKGKTLDEKNKMFHNVYNEVKEGSTISEACYSLEIDRTTFYNNITTEQKKELKTCKLISSHVHDDLLKYGIISN